jgi:hypothetical protein
MKAPNGARRYSSLSPKALALRVHLPSPFLLASSSCAKSSRTREHSRLPLRSGGSCLPSCRRTCRVSLTRACQELFDWTQTLMA